MYKQEKIKPYSEQGKKGSQVAEMFDNIATLTTFLTIRYRLEWISFGAGLQ